jgi:hypothetical protein
MEVVRAFWLLARAVWVDSAAALVFRLSMGDSCGVAGASS